MKGSYILLTELKEDKAIKIGKLGNVYFKKGFYVYIGSALNGLEHRIDRHFRKDKKKHWHIDYLLPHVMIKDIFYTENDFREECNFANKFEKNFFSIKNFGCSDCGCKSHLFYGLKNEIINLITSLDLISYL